MPTFSNPTDSDIIITRPRSMRTVSHPTIITSPPPVKEVVEQLEKLVTVLQREHGLSCAILGGNNKVVTFGPRKRACAIALGTHKELQEHKGDKEEEEDEDELLGLSGSCVGHEISDCILSINGGIKFLYAAS